MRTILGFAILAGVAAALPVTGWLSLARSRRFRIAVSLALVACSLALTAVMVGLLYGPAMPTPLEAMVLCGPVTLVVCGLAWLIERAVVGSEVASAPVPPRAVGVSALVLLALWSLCCSATSFLIPEFVDLRKGPESNLVLPLPNDLTLTAENRSCGSQSCSHTFTVATPDGAPPDQATERLWRHLTDTKGWHRDKRLDAACRRPGWLFRDEACVFVEQKGGGSGHVMTIHLTSALTI